MNETASTEYALLGAVMRFEELRQADERENGTLTSAGPEPSSPAGARSTHPLKNLTRESRKALNNPTAHVAPEATSGGDLAELYMQLARAVAAAEINRPRDQHRLRFRLEDALRKDPGFDGTDLWPLDQSSAWITKARTERAEQAADTWNTTHPVGTPVRYWTGIREGAGKQSRTRTAASVLGGHTAVVWMEGEPSCVALTHVAPQAVTA